MRKIYETPKLVIIGVDNIDVITASPAEDRDNIFENPWNKGWIQ